jgi:hypothetical protein
VTGKIRVLMDIFILFSFLADKKRDKGGGGGGTDGESEAGKACLLLWCYWIT